MGKRDIWYNLDNAANIYPAISSERNTNVFRLACELKTRIDPITLQQAVEHALEEHVAFRVIMRRGLFWFYLEHTPRIPLVVPEASRPCQRLFSIHEKALLFSVSYFGYRINLEVFHAVADGTGAMQFLHSIVHHYLTCAGSAQGLARAGEGAPPAHRTEDSFRHHYDPERKHMPPHRRAYTIGGTLLPGNDVRVISGDMPTKQVLALAKAKGVTLTAYMAALLICAIHTGLMPIRARKRPIGVTIPVDLRNHFPSQTTRNFFGVVDVAYTFDHHPPEFDAVLQSVAAQLEEKLQPEALSGRMNYTMGVQRNIFARAVPLALKNLVLKAAYTRSEYATTCTLSNLGRIQLPEGYSEHVERFTCLVNPTPIHRLKVCMCSYENHFVLNVTSCIAQNGAETYLFRHLAAAGVEVCITSNGVGEHEIL